MVSGVRHTWGHVGWCLNSDSPVVSDFRLTCGHGIKSLYDCGWYPCHICLGGCQTPSPPFGLVCLDTPAHNHVSNNTLFVVSLNLWAIWSHAPLIEEMNPGSKSAEVHETKFTWEMYYPTHVCLAQSAWHNNTYHESPFLSHWRQDFYWIYFVLPRVSFLFKKLECLVETTKSTCSHGDGWTPFRNWYEIRSAKQWTGKEAKKVPEEWGRVE